MWQDLLGARMQQLAPTIDAKNVAMLNPVYCHAIWDLLITRAILISAIYPTILLNTNNMVGNLQNPFANIRATLHFFMENAAMDIGGTKRHVLTLVRARADIQGQQDVLRLSNDPLFPTYIIRFLATPLNSVTNYPVIVYCSVFMEIMHFLKRHVNYWEGLCTWQRRTYTTDGLPVEKEKLYQ
jgi:hypothetical protein